tara:strand:+ start:70 stop:417 length:348 start_codon:yes stop_codon:yes gene_type:complete
MTEKYADLQKLFNGDKEIIRFKRKAIGLIREDNTRNKKQLAKLLYKTDIVDSVEKGLELIPSLVGEKIELSERKFKGLDAYWDGIEFSEKTGKGGKQEYFITIYHHYSGEHFTGD